MFFSRGGGGREEGATRNPSCELKVAYGVHPVFSLDRVGLHVLPNSIFLHVCIYFFHGVSARAQAAVGRSASRSLV